MTDATMTDEFITAEILQAASRHFAVNEVEPWWQGDIEPYFEALADDEIKAFGQ